MNFAGLSCQRLARAKTVPGGNAEWTARHASGDSDSVVRRSFQEAFADDLDSLQPELPFRPTLFGTRFGVTLRSAGPAACDAVYLARGHAPRFVARPHVQRYLRSRTEPQRMSFFDSSECPMRVSGLSAPVSCFSSWPAWQRPRKGRLRLRCANPGRPSMPARTRPGRM